MGMHIVSLNKNGKMDFDTFKIKYAETMLCYQMIERDVKLIYAFMCEGNIEKHYERIESKTLGQMITILKDLDNSDNDPLISNSDYNFLKQICDNRNYWAHTVFTAFIYEDDFLCSENYRKQCRKLARDHDRVERAAKLLEDFRLDFCKARGAGQ